MNCPPQESLERFALGVSPEPEQVAVQDHLCHCSTCQDAADAVTAVSQALRQSHRLFERRHEQARAEFLKALADQPQPLVEQSMLHRLTPVIHSLSDTPMKRVGWTGAGLAAFAACVLFVLTLTGISESLGAVQEIVAKIREAKSYTCTLKTEPTADAGRKERPELYKIWWTEPGSLRSERHLEGRLVETSIHPAGKSGVRINHAQSTFSNIPERNYQPGPESPGHWLALLAHTPGKTAVDIGEREFNGRMARGFLVNLSAVRPDALANGGIRLWADIETRLPVLVEIEVTEPTPTKMSFEAFTWNTSLDPTLFEANAPERYTDATPPPKTDDEEEQRIVDAFRYYAEHMGNYPKSTKFTDYPVGELLRKHGLPRYGLTNEQIQSKNYTDTVIDHNGWLPVAEIQRDNPDAAYHGETVGPNDKNKVLLRWKKDGQYRVLFGDLHYETVTSKQLKELEAK